MAYVLVVDDDRDSAEPLCIYLQRAGHEVDIQPTGKQALNAILERKPDVVILDLFMPEMDGADLLEVLRSYIRLQGLPVIILTGVPDSPLAVRANSLKVAGMFVKTAASLEDILHAIEHEVPLAKP